MILLDTHTLLWYLHNDERLSKSALDCILSENDVEVSIVCFEKSPIYSS